MGDPALPLSALTLRFSNRQMEEAYIASKRQKLILRTKMYAGIHTAASALSLGVHFVSGFHLRSTFHTDIAFTTSRAQGLCLGLLVIIGLSTLLAVHSNFLRRKLRSDLLEVLLVGIFMMALTIAVCSSPTRTCKLAGYTLQEAFGRPEAPAYDSDSTILLTIDLFVTATYLGIPVRWSTLLPLGIAAVFIYGATIALVGSEENTNSVVLNLLLLTTLVGSAMIGKKAMELEERQSFLQMIEERSKRCEAEYELAQVRETAFMSQSSEHGTDVKSHKIFEALFDKTTDRTAQLELVAEMGDSEHWRIPEDDVQLIPRGSLGHGGFGVVEKAIFCGLVVAVKRPRLDQGPLRIPDLCNELRVLRHLRHPNIVAAHGAIVRPEQQEITLVLELIDGVNLTEFLLPPSESQPNPLARFQVMLGTCRALFYMHTRVPAIVHGDLKGGNVMVEKTKAGDMCSKVLDFGLSRVLSGTSRALGGTLAWLAPEVLERAPVHTSADVYSFGRMLAFMATSIVPMREMHRQAVLKALQKKQPPMPEWPDDCPFSKACSGPVKACLTADPQKRPTIARVHRFLLELPKDVSLASEDLPYLRDVKLLAEQLEKNGDVTAEPSPLAAVTMLQPLPEDEELHPSVAHVPSSPTHSGGPPRIPFQDLNETSIQAQESLLLAAFQRWNIVQPHKFCCERHAFFQVGHEVCKRIAASPCSPVPLHARSNESPPNQCCNCGVLHIDNVCDTCGMTQGWSPSLYSASSTREEL